jgi:hypothetical protein
MPALIDLHGQQFGKWTVIERDPKEYHTKKQRTRWVCECKCGHIQSVQALNLRQGVSRGCRSCATRNRNTIRGVHVDSCGYISLYKPEHPNANHKGYVLQHRLIVEQGIGRPLKVLEVVHHIDHDRRNNHPSNLMLFDNDVQHQNFEAQCLRGLICSNGSHI